MVRRRKCEEESEKLLMTIAAEAEKTLKFGKAQKTSKISVTVKCVGTA